MSSNRSARKAARALKTPTKRKLDVWGAYFAEQKIAGRTNADFMDNLLTINPDDAHLQTFNDSDESTKKQLRKKFSEFVATSINFGDKTYSDYKARNPPPVAVAQSTGILHKVGAAFHMLSSMVTPVKTGGVVGPSPTQTGTPTDTPAKSSASGSPPAFPATPGSPTASSPNPTPYSTPSSSTASSPNSTPSSTPASSAPSSPRPQPTPTPGNPTPAAQTPCGATATPVGVAGGGPAAGGAPVVNQAGNQVAAPGTGLGQTYRATPQFTSGTNSDPNRYFQAPPGNNAPFLPPVPGAPPGAPLVPNPNYVDTNAIEYAGKGDSFKDVQDVHSEENNLRAEFGEASAKSVIPNVEKQIESDIRFDMFDMVLPGFGEGSDNKLYLMSERREEAIVHQEPHFFPGDYIGPLNGMSVPPWQLQREMPVSEVKAYSERKRKAVREKADVFHAYDDSSTNLLGDDVGYPYSHSAGELKRSKRSPLEPVIRTDLDWQHVKNPTGVKLNKLGMRRVHDALREPRNLQVDMAGVGGPRLEHRRSLEVILR